ncbi:hypothetical protein BU23DRAFT_263200 [Bimuria novae-zelandiae CBS 107.79]|uniref:Uncharacterized protein n=1 Tax=Bimuria novae-zelandiae CBS 107.79 TaxID=1447943 RepID=A0A6A5UTG8_9PLEO|nr:hypothetical protein BU23DRAFT_263200 [Bimuria novae-zelandiae CBS 107.79]
MPSATFGMQVFIFSALSGTRHVSGYVFSVKPMTENSMAPYKWDDTSCELLTCSTTYPPTLVFRPPQQNRDASSHNFRDAAHPAHPAGPKRGQD